MNNRSKLIFSYLDSICNKFQLFSAQIKGNIDVLMISETKVNDGFNFRNVLINGFSTPYRSDCDSKGGGIILFVGEDIQSNLLE